MNPGRTSRVFLSAEWRRLAMFNYVCPPEILTPHVPAGTTLDTFGGRHYVSLVGFLFRDTRVLGIPVPFHRHFEEVNLRFYVTARAGGEVRRGVVFVREIVPRRAIATVANRFFDERYVALPMSHQRTPERVEYGWRSRDGDFRLRCDIAPETQPVEAGSEAEFITEHYHGYTRRRNGGTTAYRVGHPRWRVHPVTGHATSGDFGAFYGREFGEVMARPPASVFVANGSRITVSRPERWR